MRLLKFTRYAEWWEYKLKPLLCIGYYTILLYDFPLEKAIFRIFFLLMAIVIGAVYVSVINDLTDIDEDARVGKNNRMAQVSLLWRIIIVGFCIIIGIGFGYFIYPDLKALIFYILAYVVFTLYSVRPVRLKNRGFWGVLCDAAGAHFFPSLLILTNLTFFFDGHTNIIWILSVGLWSLAYGLRGILWHQFYDRENDIASGTKTFAVGINPENFRIQEKAIFSIEILALVVIISFIFNIWIFSGMVLYLILVLIRNIAFKYKTAIIISPASKGYQLLMNDFYLVFFPLSLLLSLSINNKFGWLVLAFHILLFPRKTTLIVKDFYYFFKMFLEPNSAP